MILQINDPSLKNGDIAHGIDWRHGKRDRKQPYRLLKEVTRSDYEVFWPKAEQWPHLPMSRYFEIHVD